jgi:hypothetical protein
MLSSATGNVASAQFSDSNFAGQVNNVRNNTQQLTSSVTSFLQSQGRWFPQPQGADMQLCQELSNLQQQVDRLSRDAGGRQSVPMLQGQLQQIQNTTGRIEGMFAMINPNRDVRRKWNRVKDGVNSASQALFSGGGFNPYNPNPYNPYNPNPYNPNPYNPNPYNPYNPNFNQPSVNTGALTNALKKTTNDTQQMMNQLAVYLATPGRPPIPAGQDTQLVQELQMFQQQVNSMVRDGSSNRSFPYVQSQLQQLQFRARNIDRLTTTVANNPFVLQKWWNVKSSLDKATQALSGGGRYYNNGFIQGPENNNMW